MYLYKSQQQADSQVIAVQALVLLPLKTQHSRQFSEVNGKRQIGLLFDTAVDSLGRHNNAATFVYQRANILGVQMHADCH